VSYADSLKKLLMVGGFVLIILVMFIKNQVVSVQDLEREIKNDHTW
jgi:hypothetical protein